MAFGTTNLQGSPQALGTTFFNKTIDNSLRMSDADNSSLQWSAGTPSSTSIWTMSFWIKFWDPEAGQAATEFFSAGTGGATYSFFSLNSSQNFIHETELPGARRKIWDRVIRDPSAWYHFIIRADLNQTITADKLRWYVNGVLETDTSTDGISQSTWSFINASGVTQNWGGKTGIANGNPGADIYLAEINFCDGQSYGPEYFGENKNGVWIPKEPDVTYGDNGYRLEFKQTGTGTGSASTVGADTSGNDNHFDSSGIASQDVNSDSPTNNFCTMNSVAYTNGITLTKGGQTVATTTNNRGIYGTMSLPSSGKWYYEIRVDSYASNGGTYLGWGTNVNLGFDEAASNKGIFFSGYNEQVLLDGSGQSGGYGSTGTNVASNGDIYSILLDVDNGLFYYAKNGTYFNSADPGAGTGGLDVSTTLAAATTLVVPTITRGGSYNETYSVNFGQNPSFSGTLTGGSIGTAVGGGGIFKYAPPAGFKALKASNLPEPILTPRNESIENSYFYTTLYEGNGGGQRIGQFLPLNEVKTVNNAIRFNDDDSNTFTKTPSADGNRKIMTWSLWFKRGNLGGTQTLIGGGQTNGIMFQLNSSNQWYFYDSAASFQVYNTVAFNQSQWSHLVFAIDTNQSTDTDRFKFYIDGELQDLSTWSAGAGNQKYPTLNSTISYNTTSLGMYYGKVDATQAPLDGYLADIHFVDGQALTPTSFAQTDPSTEKWIPKTFTGNHGKNGHHLEFLNSSSLGADSANGYNFTATDFPTRDQVIDTPTKNYPTFDEGNLNSWTLSNGNLYASISSNNLSIKTTIPIFPNSGKWYWEVLRVDTASGGGDKTFLIGLTKTDSVLSDNPYSGTNNYSLYDFNGTLYFEGTNLTPYGSKNQDADDIHMIAYDSFTGATWFGVNGTWYNSATASEIANGNTTNAAFIIPKHEQGHVPFLGRTGGTNAAPAVINFGQDPSFAGELTGGAIGTASDGYGSLFKYAPPTGYKALNNDNLPAKGTRGIARRKTPVITWIKNRDSTDSHMLFDSLRGPTKVAHPDLNAVETTEVNTLQKFLPGGFQIGNDVQVNTTGESYVAWNWCMHDDVVEEANSAISGSGFTDAKRLVDKRVGLSVITYTATAGTGTIDHGLGVTPDMIIATDRGHDVNWFVWHTGLANASAGTHIMNLDTGAAEFNPGINHLNDTAPTASAFAFGGYMGAHADTSGGGQTKMLYAFKSVPGYSKFGSYTGTADADGAFIPLGFNPAWLMIADATTTNIEWNIFDTTRYPNNQMNSLLQAASSAAETANVSTRNLDFVSGGIKFRDQYAQNYAARHIYWAMAESPFKYTNAR